MLSLIKVLLPPSDFPRYTDTPPHDCMRSPHSLVGDVIHIARAARVKARGAIQNLCDAENTGLTLAVLTKVSVIKVFETASRANGGRLWLVWLMTLRGSPLVLQAA
jgi:hypothetical protein